MDEFKPRDAETTHTEMRAILATDLGIAPERVLGYVIVLAIKNGENMQPTVRASVGATTASYLMASAMSDLLYLTVADTDHPDHEDICGLPRDEHDK